MTGKAARIAWFSVLLVFCARQVHALDPERAVSQYVRDRWGSDRGLPGEVHAITQTRDGYLWIGTERGLFRFDGLTFHPVPERDPSAVPVTHVVGLDLDPQGNVLVRLPERNLLRYTDSGFQNILYSLQPRELAVTAMCPGIDGSLLVAGLVNGVMSYRAGRFTTLAPVTALPPSPIIAVAQTADGKVWLGTRDTGLFVVANGRVTSVGSGLPNRQINALLASGPDLWIGTEAGLARWNGSAIRTEGVPPSLRGAPVLSLRIDRRSNLWVGARTGLFRVNASGVSTVESRENPASGAVNTVFEDREGNLWIGTASGIERLRDSSFTTFGRAEGLPSDQNGPLYAAPDGRVWFAPIEGGLYWLTKGQSGRVMEAGLANDVVYAIGGSAADLWLGRQRGGLTHLHFRNGAVLTESYTQANGLAQNSVYSVYLARDGTVWAGTVSGGVSRLHDGKFTNYAAANGLGSNTVASMLEDANGTMWFATPNGLRALSRDRWSGFTVNDGLPSDEVNCLTEDSRGILWVGTAGGLAAVSAGAVKALPDIPESLREPVFGIVEGKSGALWMVTASHVVRANRDNLLRGVLTDSEFREYGLDDGLRSVAGIRRDRSVVRDPLGRVWFSMSSGISAVDPAQLSNNSAPVIVSVQSISADNAPIDLHARVRIPAPPRRITFSYSGLSLSGPERVHFRYALDGYDSGWSEPTAAREAAYTNLGPGPYRFRVIASNADGVWNPAETFISFEIVPRFWQTWWFRLSMVIAAGLAVLGLYHLRLRQLTGRLNVRFEERLEERTRIAQELHDTLLQGFISASMQLHVAVDRLPGDSPAKPGLTRVLELMRGVIEDGRNAVRGLRSAHRASLNLEQAFSEIQKELEFQGETRFRVIVTGQVRPLHPLLRDEVYRIGREALVNAVRHAKASAIEVELQYSVHQLRLLVRDDGCGIDPKVLQGGRDGHWGLPGMRERAERIGAKLHLWSSASAGTEVELLVPSQVAFQPEPSRRSRPEKAKSGSAT